MVKIILSEPLRVAKDDFIILINELPAMLWRPANTEASCIKLTDNDTRKKTYLVCELRLKPL